jgi:hypothetical protein
MIRVNKGISVRTIGRRLLRWPRRARNLLRRTLAGSSVQEQEIIPISRLSPSELDEIHQHFPMPKFFVLGHGRSGTTLLARLIRLHPEVHCNWQAHFFTKQQALTRVFPNAGLMTWLGRSSNRWTAEERLETSLLRVVCDYIMEREARRGGKRIVGDKSPDSSVDVPVEDIHLVYPDARIIHIVRDGRDAVLSRRMQLFVDAPSMFGPADLEIREALERDAAGFYESGRSVFTESWLEEAATCWSQNVHNTDAIARDLYGDQYFPLRYEDIITTPDEWLARIWRFLEAGSPTQEVFDVLQAEMNQNPAVAWQQEKAPRIVEGLRRGSAGGWRKVFTEADRRIFEREAGEELQRWGYEVGVG